MGPIIKNNLNRALTIVAGDLVTVLLRPITLTLLLLAVITAAYSFREVFGMARTTKGAGA